jgi:transposase
MSEGPRLLRPDRSQLSWDVVDLDSQLAEDHQARLVWDYVCGLDVSGLERSIKARDDRPGRPTPDRRLYVGLWLYATLQGVGSARELDRLCRSHAAYRWLCGGVRVNYHDLADFRTEAGAFLDDLLSRSVAGLVHEGLVSLDCLSVDGVRVRASAGKGSFRSQPRLEELHGAAMGKVAALKAELAADGGASSRRLAARRLQAAQDRAQRVKQAQAAAQEIAEERARDARKQRRKQEKKSKPPRASTTDPQARVMMMPDGGVRPAYNVQLKTDPASGIVVGVSVTNCASDRGLLGPAAAELFQRYGHRPRQLLSDGGYDSKDDIEALHRPENGAIEVYCPIPRSKGKPVPPAPKRGEGPGVIAWRERMSTQAAYDFYAQRIKAERPHAQMRNRGFRQLLVRGTQKALAVGLGHVTAYNFLQMRFLQDRAARAGAA